MSSLWMNSIENKTIFNSIESNKICDVCIIGAGITGLSTGYYLSKKGLSVIILDKFDIGTKTSGNTTGKITYQHNLIYDYLINSKSKKFAFGYLEANKKAISNIHDIVQEENIDCDFEFQSNYVYTTSQETLPKIHKEIEALHSLGEEIEFVTESLLPFKIAGALENKNQAQINLSKYMLGLANCIEKYGGNIYTNSLVTDVKNKNNEYITFANNYAIKSKYVVLASHYPFINFPGFFFSKMYQSTSYALAVDTNSDLLDGMYINSTGFNKWGITSSNIAANIITDKILGKNNKFEFIFDSNRLEPVKNRNELKNMASQIFKSFISNRIKVPEADLDEIKRDNGGIIKIDGVNIGIYKDISGNIFSVNPTCTHLGCLLTWNNLDKTWDCPCHGSRFDYNGKNIYDPAFKDLEKFHIY